MPSSISTRYPAALRSSSGAFDLPSIITGVVVVGILAAGVLTAIFGVIPFAQDHAAKQDLMAINTAQGVTYAKDGQKFKDLEGLEGAGLLSGVEPEKTEVTTTNEGKGFLAVVTSGTGQKWFITHENTVPEKLNEGGDPAPPSDAPRIKWAVGACQQPGVEEYYDWQLDAMADPRFEEFMKALNSEGYGDFDMDLASAWNQQWQSGPAPGMELIEESGDWAVTDGLQEVIQPILNTKNDFMAGRRSLDGYQQWHADVAAAPIAMKSFCETYR
ncbi:hypothetical protein [Arthrobacter sp. IK3]|uniref:hypothetical protein n=1 Tax=Arthrobacter sp. IK3 TaxID=3448169 RepID=UPI003EE2F48F